MNPSSSSPSGPTGRRPWKAPSLSEMQALLPQYQFIALIGRGGMGAVYKAIQTSLGRPVAIKVLPAQVFGDSDPKGVARFRQEALTLAKLAHPGIVTIYESGEAGGLPFIAMEFIDGTDVARMIKSEGRLEPERAIAILFQVCEALQHAHQFGVIHRDIKPANLLLTRAGQVKIADFGLAKHHDETFLGLTKSDLAVGTPDFLAPEAWSLAAPLDHRADLYSLGVTLYQMLTGEVPRGLWKMPSVKVGVDPRFDAIIDRAMQPEREARYQSTAELRRDLERIHTTPAPPKQTSQGRLWPFALASAVVAVLTWIVLLLATRAPSRPVLSFNGANQLVIVTNFGLVAPTNEVTVEFWAYQTQIAGFWAFDLEQESNFDNFRGSVSSPDRTLYWDFGPLIPSGRLLASQPDDVMSNWVHYAFVASQKRDFMSAYADGQLLGSKDHCDPFIRFPGDLRVGGGGDTGFAGRLAEFQVWNRARSQAQIKADMETRLTGKEDGLLLYLPFDEGSGDQAANHASLTGGAYNARLVNHPAWLTASAPPKGPVALPLRSAHRWVVTSLWGYGEGTLRQIAADATDGDIITFATNLSGKTIHMSTSEIVLAKDVTVDASALPEGIVIDASHVSRVLEVSRRASVILRGLTLTNGFADRGAGVRNMGYLQMIDCTVCGCEATVKGGGIYTLESPLSMTGCTVAGNTAEWGGGLWAGFAASLSLTNCTIAGNQAHSDGGGLCLQESQADIAACSVADNSALTNGGGGISLLGSLLTLGNAIVAANHAQSDPDLKTSESRFSPTGPNLTNGNPLLAPLGNYGGRTLTMPPQPGSPALGAGVSTSITNDQRGFLRPLGAAPDIGAIQGANNHVPPKARSFPE